MLDALQEALSGVVISAVMQEAVVHEVEHGFLIPSWTGKRFCDAKAGACGSCFDSQQSEEPVLFTEQALYMQPGCILSLFTTEN
ncbi:MAG: hypothetical protein ACLRL6_01370 [Clostridium sp.]